MSADTHTPIKSEQMIQKKRSRERQRITGGEREMWGPSNAPNEYKSEQKKNTLQTQT